METVAFDHTPHYKTVCDKKSHFSRISDALAEFIDNSVQACRNNEEKLINIGFISTKAKHVLDSTYITIGDNGFGMTQQDVMNFARYALDQETKAADGIHSSYTDGGVGNHSISKFGVGAKEAGFFLGDRMTVVSKNRDVDYICELTLDEKEYEQRYKNQQSVYGGKLHKANSVEALLYPQRGADYSSASQASSETEELKTIIKAHCAVNPDQFTMIIIRVRPNLVPQLMQKELKICLELAAINYFVLHPEHKPNVVISEQKYQNPGLFVGNRPSNVPSESLPIPVKPPRSLQAAARQSSAKEIPVQISVKVLNTFSRVSNEYSLNNFNTVNGDGGHGFQGDIMQQYFEKAVHAFRFNMIVPDPSPSDDISYVLEESHGFSATQGTSTQAEKRKLKNESTNAKVVEGLILYFPFTNGKESKPTHSIVPHVGKAARGKGSSSGSLLLNEEFEDDSDSDEAARTSRSCDRSKVYDRIDNAFDLDMDSWEGYETYQSRQDRSVFSVYWQNRLVPNSVCDRIPIFNQIASSALGLEEQKIASKWQGRIKGFLFFDWSFHNISNNKLKLTLDPSLEGWLNACKDREILWSPQNTAPKFVKWLQGCHRYFDQEIKLINRNFTLEGESYHKLLKQYKNRVPPDTKQFSLFQTMIVANCSSKLTAGTIVKLSRNLASSGLAKKKEIYGNIVAFEVTPMLTASTVEYQGPGAKIRYRREPYSLYGDMKEYTDVSFPLAILGNLNNIEEVSQNELQKLAKMAPSALKLRVCKESYDDPQYVMTNGSFRVDSGAVVKEIAVQILDGYGNATIGKPFLFGSAANSPTTRYKVSLFYMGNEICQPTYMVYWYDREKAALKLKQGGAGAGMTQRENARTDCWESIKGYGGSTPQEKKKLNDAYYSFGDIKGIADNLGVTKITAKVLDDNVVGPSRVILEQSFEINVVQTPVDKIEMKPSIIDEKNGILENGFNPGVILSMDSKFPVFEIHMKNKAGEPIPYVGNILLKLVNINMGISLGVRLDMENSFVQCPVYEMESSDMGVLLCEDWDLDFEMPKLLNIDKGGLINPKKGVSIDPAFVPILGRTTVCHKTLEFELSVFAATSEKDKLKYKRSQDSPSGDCSYATIMGEPISFVLEYGSGSPKFMEVCDDHCKDSLDFSVVFGEKLPTKKIFCFDKFGQLTGPMDEEPWKAAVSSQLASLFGIEKSKSKKGARADEAEESSLNIVIDSECASVVSGGYFQLTDMTITSNLCDKGDDMLIPTEGLEMLEYVYLIIPQVVEHFRKQPHKGTMKDLKAYLDKADFVPKLPINVLVKPNRVPTVLEIWRGGEMLGTSDSELNSIECPCGEILDGLTVRILDQHRNLMPFDGERLFTSAGGKSNNTGIKYSWAPKGERTQRYLKTDDIPVLKLPTSIETEEPTYSVSCVVLGVGEIVCDFVVKLVPDEPVRWTILTQIKEKYVSTAVTDEVQMNIMANNGIDLNRKICGVCLVDKYDNLVSVPTGDFYSPGATPSSQELSSSPVACSPASGAATAALKLCKLVIRWQTLNSDDIVATVALDAVPQKKGDILCYVLGKDAGIVVPLRPSSSQHNPVEISNGGRIPLPCQVRLEVVDLFGARGRIVGVPPPYCCMCSIIAGLPLGIQISSESCSFVTPYRTANEMSSQSSPSSAGALVVPTRVSVNQFFSLDDLCITFYDQHGNLASVTSDDNNGVSLIQNLRVEIMKLRVTPTESTPLTILTPSDDNMDCELENTIVKVLQNIKTNPCRVGSMKISELFLGENRGLKNAPNVVKLSFRFTYISNFEGEMEFDSNCLTMAPTPIVEFEMCKMNLVDEVKLYGITLKCSELQSGSREHEVHIDGASDNWDDVVVIRSDERPPYVLIDVGTTNNAPLECILGDDSLDLAEVFNFKFVVKTPAIAISRAKKKNSGGRYLNIEKYYSFPPTVILPAVVEDVACDHAFKNFRTPVKSKSDEDPMYDMVLDTIRGLDIYNPTERTYLLLSPLPNDELFETDAQEIDSISAAAVTPVSNMLRTPGTPLSAKNTMKSDTVLFDSGKVYEINVAYKELRSQFATLPNSFRKCVANVPLIVNCKASKMVRFEPHATSKAKLLHCAVTNSRMVSDNDRTMAIDAKFTAKDKYNRITTFPRNCHLICSLRLPATDTVGDTESGTLPVLKTSSIDTNTFIVSSSSSSTDIHKLAHSLGVVLAKKTPGDEDEVTLVFPVLELLPEEEGSTGKDGTIEMVFQIFANDETLLSYLRALQSGSRGSMIGNVSSLLNSASDASSNMTSSEPLHELVVPFTLYTDSGRAEEQKAMKKERDECANICEEYEQHVRALHEKVREKNMEINNLIMNSSGKTVKTLCHNQYDGYSYVGTSSGECLTQSEVGRLKRELESQMKDLTARYGSKDSDGHGGSGIAWRKAIRGSYSNDHQLMGMKGIVGRVVDMGFCDDEVDARILSWAGAYYMDVVVVNDDVNNSTINSFRTWNFSDMEVYKVKDGNGKFRSRNEDEKYSGQLPLPPIVMDSNHFENSVHGFRPQSEQASGNPKYLVNLINLPFEKEHLRDTLFYNIYKNSMLFDDMDTAFAYRKAAMEKFNRRTGPKPPKIFTRDGYSIGTDGVRDPTASGRMPHELKNVYGQDGSYLEELESGVSVLRTVEDIIVERDHISEELEEYLAFESSDEKKDVFLKSTAIAKDRMRELDVKLNSLIGAVENNNRVGDKRGTGVVADPRISKKRRN